MPRKKISIFPFLALEGIVIALFLALKIFGLVNRKTDSNHAEISRIAYLSTALESYKVEYGDYPKATHAFGPTSSASANILYQTLAVSNATYNPSGKIFFEPTKHNTASTNFGSATNYFVDPFGQPYQYRYPGDPEKSGTNFFDLFSYGGSTKTADNSNNWETWVKNW